MNFDTQIPNKDSYKFKEVTSITGVKPYVLRFWESEFSQITPSKSEAGHKVYSSKDVEYIQKIKDLLFESKLSIPEAKLRLVEDLEKQRLLELEEREKALQLKSENQQPLSQSAESKVTPDNSTNTVCSNVFSSQSSSFELMQNALKLDLSKHTEQLQNKQFNDSDVVHLVQAKKKLSVMLSKCNSLIADKNWH